MRRILITLFLLSSPLQAADYDVNDHMALYYQNEDVISLATSSEKPLHLAPSVATVITAEQLHKSGHRFLYQALELVPGVHVSRAFNRLNAIYSIRGIHTAESAQLLVLINGQRIENTINGGLPPLFRLPVGSISRIEIIRGPGSALHGADAFSGVINVITKQADELESLEMGLAAGSFASHEYWLRSGGELFGWQGALHFEYATSDGDQGRVVESDLQTLFDSSFGTTASLAPSAVSTGYELYNSRLTLQKRHWEFEVASWNLRDAGVGAGVAGPLDPLGRQRSDVFASHLDFSDYQLGDGVSLDTRLAYQRTAQEVTFQLFPPGSKLPVGDDGNLFTSGGGYVLFSDGVHGNPGGTDEKLTWDLSLSFQAFDSHQLRLAFGAAYGRVNTFETKNFGPGVIDGTTLSTDPNNPTIIDGTLTDVTGTDDIFMHDVSRTVRYIALQDEWQMARDWELTAGVRYDHYSDVGETINPRLALVWAADYNLTGKLLYGSAFRAPSYSELYFKNNPATVGNPQVRPESIDMLEWVLDYHPTFDLHTVLNLYRYEIDGLINYVAGTAENAHNQRGQGLEFDLNWQLMKRLQLEANYAWQDSWDQQSGRTIANAPRQQLSAMLTFQANHSCHLGSQFNWVADRARAVGDDRPEIDDYTTVDFSASCGRPSDALEVYVVMNNVLDEDAREPSLYNPVLGAAAIEYDYPLEGRSLFLGLNYRLD